ncbi:helix-turn-helix transcriptional regulator [Kalamiella sp. sgz302252]|uniref:helix-turn-helix transcriptional regulator n=1 Tax=Pantoea sp. sgz302252 TaxID=3341827 RepID=UPI0036D3F24A
MSRSERLLKLIQLLRGRRYPVTAAFLAEELGIHIRTLYRDIATLQQQGACIQGEAGMGYLLRKDYLLPPLMFTQPEIEALLLGISWVKKRGDPDLTAAASEALAKIGSVIPAALKQTVDYQALLVGPTEHDLPQIWLAELRQAIRQRNKVEITYKNLQDQESRRVIWPVAVGYFDAVRLLAAWCERRQQLRHFRTDRIQQLVILHERYPRQHHELLAAWKKEQGIAAS